MTLLIQDSHVSQPKEKNGIEVTATWRIRTALEVILTDPGVSL